MISMMVCYGGRYYPKLFGIEASQAGDSFEQLGHRLALKLLTKGWMFPKKLCEGSRQQTKILHPTYWIKLGQKGLAKTN